MSPETSVSSPALWLRCWLTYWFLSHLKSYGKHVIPT